MSAPLTITDCPKPRRAVAADFAPLLGDFNLDAFDEHDATIFGLDGDLRLAYFNEAWVRFACENSGTVDLIDPSKALGSPFLNGITPDLRPFFRDAFCSVLDDQKVWDHAYECSSPTTVRFFHIEVLPLHDLATDQRGLLVVNSFTEPIGPFPLRTPNPQPNPKNYVSADGFLTQCSHCRRFRRIDRPEQWDWLPEYINDPPGSVSHGLCIVCLEYYYPR